MHVQCHFELCLNYALFIAGSFRPRTTYLLNTYSYHDALHANVLVDVYSCIDFKHRAHFENSA